MDRPHPTRLRRRLRLSVVLLLFCVGGCTNKDADRLAQLGVKLGQKLEALLGPGNNRVLHAMPAVPLHLGDPALDARVAARLTWEKTLADTTIQVQVIGGVVELRGKVRDLEQKRRAFELAQTTLGVEKVADRLELAGGDKN